VNSLKDGGVLEKIYYDDIELPIGTVWAAASDKGLVRVHALGTGERFKAGLRGLKAELIPDPDRFNALREQLNLWVEGRYTEFDLPLDLRGTEFQKEVWRAIHRIPYGKLSSYGLLAKDIGRPAAARAVGNAVGANPIGIVIPCHRVIWSNGGIGGFGGGYSKESLDVKRLFLKVEGVLPRVEDSPEDDVDLKKFFP
jgi:methylated-DNA-[protein]-cysteine S-methyltransferase